MRWSGIALAAAWLGAVAGCALGTESAPGCHADGECAEGFICRSGACLRTTTDLSPPEEGDAGDAGDAGG